MSVIKRYKFGMYAPDIYKKHGFISLGHRDQGAVCYIS